LTAALFISSAAAGLAAVSSEPAEQTGIDAGLGPIRIDDDRAQPATSEIPSGNPLWAIPLKELSATRERPIFSPSRRAPAPVVATAPNVPPQPAKPVEPERPQLSLVGTIAGDNESFGIFLDRSVNTVLRLKLGEAHKGWVLREVRSREIVLEKGDKTATLALPARPPVAPVRHDEEEKDSKRSRR
jgi:general secretion pathway protein N